MRLSDAQPLATQLLTALSPHCHRAAIAGGVRRGKAQPHDIEIVCIPHSSPADLFGGTLTHSWGFAQTVRRWPLIQGDPLTGRAIQIDLGPCRADLFTCTPANWGLIFLLRTGSKAFNMRLVLALRNRQIQIRHAQLWRRGDQLSTTSEAEIFAYVGWPEIPPHARS